MEVGRQKGNFRLRLIDLKTGKSKTATLHAKTNKYDLNYLMKKMLDCLLKE